MDPFDSRNSSSAVKVHKKELSPQKSTGSGSLRRIFDVYLNTFPGHFVSCCLDETSNTAFLSFNLGCYGNGFFIFQWSVSYMISPVAGNMGVNAAYVGSWMSCMRERFLPGRSGALQHCPTRVVTRTRLLSRAGLGATSVTRPSVA